MAIMTAPEIAALAGAITLAGAIAITPSVDDRAEAGPVCVLDTAAVHASPHKWATWPVCVQDPPPACEVADDAGAWHAMPYCAEEIGAP